MTSMQTESKKILVTGGAGYVGCVLVKELLNRGYKVRVLDKMIFGDQGLVEVKDQIDLVVGDILSPPAGVFEGIDSVIHLAGLSSQSKSSYHSPRYTDLVNHIGTEILAKAAKEAGIKRFIFASSCSIYSAFRHTPGQTVPTFDEDSEVQIQGPYALSRRAAEECLLELADGSFHPVIFRKGTLYGFSPKMRYDLVLNAFTKDAFRQGKITVNAAGDIDRPILDVQDAVEAYIAALELPISAVSGKIFNLMSSNIQLIDLANMFKKILKETKNKVVEIDLKPFDVTVSYRANGTRFQKTFNFKPKRTLEAAILEIWDQLEDGHDYENLKYYNDPWHFEALKQGLL